MTDISQAQQDALDAATFRKLLAHLDSHKDVQNIDLMITANFCRNCLSKWYKKEADIAGINVSDDEARQHIYGMPYGEWKDKHQLPATEAQLAAFAARSEK